MPGILDWLDNAFTGTPNPKGGTDYLGGLVNYTPPAGPSDRFGLFGATLRDIGSNLAGRPDAANALDAWSADNRQRAMRATYPQILAGLFGRPQFKPITVTPRVTMNPDGSTNRASPSAYASDAATYSGGPLSSLAPTMLPILNGMQPEQGLPLLGELALKQAEQSIPQIQVIDLSDGRKQAINARTGTPIGSPFGPRKSFTLHPGDTLYGDAGDAGDGGGVSGSPLPSPSSLPRLNDVRGAVSRILPGARFTSDTRTPAQNAAVNGADNSLHLPDATGEGDALDFVPPGAKWTQADLSKFGNQLRGAGIPYSELLLEDANSPHSTGYHVHVGGWRAGSPNTPVNTPAGSTPNIPGYRAFSTGPAERPMTPDELKRYNALDGSTINTATGEVHRVSSYQMPSQLSDPALKQAIATYIQTGNLPRNMGRGGVPTMQAIQNGAAAMKPDGMTDDDWAAQIARNAQDYKAGGIAVNRFDTGRQGDSVRFINNALGHLDLLAQYGQALNNGNARSINDLKLKIQQEFGSAAPTNFDAVRDLVGNEIVKSVVNSGGGVSDRNEARDTISRVGSWGQLAGVINSYRTILGTQLLGLGRQYKASTGRGDFSGKYLSPESARYYNEAAAANRPMPSPSSLPRKNAGGANANLPHPKTPAEAMSLKPGTQFVTPDGRVKVR